MQKLIVKWIFVSFAYIVLMGRVIHRKICTLISFGCKKTISFLRSNGDLYNKASVF